MSRLSSNRPVDAAEAERLGSLPAPLSDQVRLRALSVLESPTVSKREVRS